MATTKDDTPDVTTWPGLELAIEGAGLSPADIPTRHLASLLEAAAALFERVAEERGVKVEAPRLVEVRTGSAAYALRSPDVEAGPVFDELEEHVAQRGRGASSQVRSAIDRLHKSSKGVGSIRLARFEGAVRSKKVVHVAPPLSVEPATFEESRELFGVIVAVDAGQRKGASVKIRLDDGATKDFDADIAIAQRAAGLFTRTARALVTFTVTGGAETDGQIEELDGWEGVDAYRMDPLGAFAGAATLARDQKIRASDWLDDLFASDEDE